ncbi:AAA ATPase midasin, partial [Perkinsus olseni]
MPHFCRLLVVLDSYDQLSAQAETSILIFLREFMEAKKIQSPRTTRPPAAAVTCPAHLPMYASASESDLELILEAAIRNISTLYQSFSGDQHAQTLGDLLAQIRSLGVLARRARAGDEDAKEKLIKLEIALTETATKIITTTREQHEKTAADDSDSTPKWPAELLKCSGELSAQRYDHLALACPWPVVDSLALRTEAAWSTGSISADLASVESLYSKLTRRGSEALLRAHGGWATVLGASVAEAVLRWPISEVPEAAKLASYMREVTPSAAKAEEAA